jgi:hypothetical protein
MTREEMTATLQSGVCNVVFTKVDGTTRNMRCTQVRDLIPSDHQPKPPEEGATERVQSTETIRVFDLTVVGWRSFRVDSVTSFSVE